MNPVMLRLVVTRIAISLLTLWIVSVLVFGATELLPGDVAQLEGTKFTNGWSYPHHTTVIRKVIAPGKYETLEQGAAAHCYIVEQRPFILTKEVALGLSRQTLAWISKPKTSFRPADKLARVPLTCWKCCADAGTANDIQQVRTRRTLEETFLRDIENLLHEFVFFSGIWMWEPTSP